MVALTPSQAFPQQITFLYTDDLERSTQFYHQLLGLEQVLDQGNCRIFRTSPTGFLGICDRPDRPRGTTGVMVCFLCRDVYATYQHLWDRGVIFEGPPQPRQGGSLHSAFFPDPTGYTLEIQEFRDPRWPDRV